MNDGILWRVVCLAAGLSVAATLGCATRQNPLSVENTEKELAQAVREMIAEEPDLYGIDELDDEEPRPENYSYLAVLPAKPIVPLRIGRQVQERDFSVSVVLESQAAATATVVHTISGIFHVVYYDSETETLNDKSLPFTDEATRTLKLERRANTGEPRRDWRLAQISLVEVISEESAVHIEQLTFSSEGENIITIDAPATEFLIDKSDSIPTFRPGTEVTVTVKVASEGDGAALTMLHHGFGQFRRARTRLNDDGLNGDAVAGDGIYTGRFRIPNVQMLPQQRFFFHAFVDVFSRDTIFDSDAPYNCTAWGFPYKVQRVPVF